MERKLVYGMPEIHFIRKISARIGFDVERGAVLLTLLPFSCISLWDAAKSDVTTCFSPPVDFCCCHLFSSVRGAMPAAD